MYKVPVMPYVKLNLLYNFGMEFNMDNLSKGAKYYAWDKYKFSSLNFDFILGLSFGRPK